MSQIHHKTSFGLVNMKAFYLLLCILCFMDNQKALFQSSMLLRDKSPSTNQDDELQP